MSFICGAGLYFDGGDGTKKVGAFTETCQRYFVTGQLPVFGDPAIVAYQESEVICFSRYASVDIERKYGLTFSSHWPSFVFS